jgi:hypothetical protein
MFHLKMHPDSSLAGSDKEGPQSFADYEIINHWDKDCLGSKKVDLPKGVNSHLRHLNSK